MSKIVPRPFCVLVGYDFSDQANLALKQAVRIAATSATSEIHVLTAVGKDGLKSTDPDHEDDYQGADQLLSAVEATLDPIRNESDGDLALYAHTRIGKAADLLLELSEEISSDLILVGTRGQSGLKKALLGSVAEEIVGKAKCPVLVMREKTLTPSPRVEVEYEASNDHPRAHALRLARAKVDSYQVAGWGGW